MGSNGSLDGVNGRPYPRSARESAAQLRALAKPFEIVVAQVGGDPIRLLVRRPDLRKLAYERHLETPLLAKIADLLTKWIGQELKAKTDEDLTANGADVMATVDRLLVEVLVEPRFVLDPSTLDAIDRETVLGPADLPCDVKERIVSLALQGPAMAARLRQEETVAAGRFPAERAGDGAGPDVPPVPPAAE